MNGRGRDVKVERRQNSRLTRATRQALFENTTSVVIHGISTVYRRGTCAICMRIAGKRLKTTVRQNYKSKTIRENRQCEPGPFARAVPNEGTCFTCVRQAYVDAR